MSDVNDDDPTLVRPRPVALEDLEALLDARDQRDELLEALCVPDGVDPTAFAVLVRACYQDLVERAGLAEAGQAAVAICASPHGLFILATGGSLAPDNPLAALRKPAADA